MTQMVRPHSVINQFMRYIFGKNIRDESSADHSSDLIQWNTPNRRNRRTQERDFSGIHNAWSADYLSDLKLNISGALDAWSADYLSDLKLNISGALDAWSADYLSDIEF